MTAARRTSRSTPGSASQAGVSPAGLASRPDRWEAHQVSGDEVRDGVSLTNLDQPLFDGAERDQAGPGRLPGRGQRPDHPGAARPAAVGDPGAARPGAVHAEERPQVHAAVGADGAAVGRGLEARGLLRAVQRPPHAAVVRQPAGGGVPPGPGPWPVTGPTPPTWCSTSTRRRADAFGLAVQAALLVRQALADAGLAGAVKTSGAKGAARVRAARRRARPSRTWPRPPGRSPRAPSGSTRRSPPRRSSGRTAAARFSSTRPGPAARRWWRPTARGSGPGAPVSFPVAWDELDRVAPADFTVRTAPALLAGGDPWADQMPPPQRLSRRPDRGGPRHPGRPGAGDARGQAARPRPPQPAGRSAGAGGRGRAAAECAAPTAMLAQACHPL